MTTTDIGNPLHDLYTSSQSPPVPAGWATDQPVMVPAPVPDDTPTTADVQARAEGVPADVLNDSNSLLFKGRRFRLAESIGLMPLLKFAHAAKSGLTSDDMEGLSAMYLLIRSCVDRTKPDEDTPSQWELFEQHAIDTDADGEELSGVITSAVQVISSRPPKRRGGSSPSSSPTSESGKDYSSSPGIRRVPAGFEGMTPVGDLGR